MIPDNNNEPEKEFKNNTLENKPAANRQAGLDDKDKKEEYNYGKKPKNHTTTEERLINPDRGE